MQEPTLNEEELEGLSEEEKAEKLARLEEQKKAYWKERYRRNIYEFGDYEPKEEDLENLSPSVVKAVEKIDKKILEWKKEGKIQS